MQKKEFVTRVWASVGNLLALPSGSAPVSRVNIRHFENKKIYVPQNVEKYCRMLVSLNLEFHV